jgi:hypothetical protein
MIEQIPINTYQVRIAKICHGFLRILPFQVPFLVRICRLNKP